jgi:hypothetical protein
MHLFYSRLFLPQILECTLLRHQETKMATAVYVHHMIITMEYWCLQMWSSISYVKVAQFMSALDFCSIITKKYNMYL